MQLYPAQCQMDPLQKSLNSRGGNLRLPLNKKLLRTPSAFILITHINAKFFLCLLADQVK